MELPERVISQDGTIGTILGLNIQFKQGRQEITYENFLMQYEEYVDPMELEIRRLNEEIKKLKGQLKPFKRPRRKLDAGEISEIQELITRGESNPSLATEYECSASRISRIRTEMKKVEID